MSLANQTVLVTGATGFLGGTLAKRLAADGVKVKALARRPEKGSFLKQYDNIEIVQGDITDAAQMRAASENCAVIFHVAAALGGSLDKQYQANVDGTRRVMLAAASAGVGRVVHVSSIAVYGYSARGNIAENAPQNPGSVPYNRTKAEAETVIQEVSAEYHLPFSIIRPGMIYGPGSNGWTRTMFELGKRKPTPWLGDGHGAAHPIYVDDVVDLTVLLGSHPNAINQVFNCAPDPAPSWREFIGSYSRLAGHDRWLGIPPILLRPIVPFVDAFLALRGEPQDLWVLLDFLQSAKTYKMDKAREQLVWQPKVSLEEGIARSAVWLREIGLLK